MATDGRALRRETRQLALVLDAVRASGCEHPTAEQVCRRVRRSLPRVSLGTVYRNLQRLVSEGRIGLTHVGSRIARYDPTVTAHDHFLCRTCGRVDDVPGDGLEAGRLARRAGYEVTGRSLVLFGRCRTCRGRR